MRLPRRLADWPEEALEEWRERASIVHEGCNGAESDWPAAKEAAVRMVRARFATVRPVCPNSAEKGRSRHTG